MSNLLQEFVRQVSEIWSGLIIGLIVLSFIISGYLIVFSMYLLSRGESAILYFMPAPFFLWLGIFPIYCLAYANGSIDTIQKSFVYQCAPTNYQVIGGRNVWIDYLKQSPAYWTLFDFAITWNVLYGVLGSVAGSILLGAASIAGTAK